MEEPIIKYCFIGKYKSSTALFEYNKLKRNQTLLEAKQMFSRCSDIHFNINESRVNSKDGSFFIKTYQPDLIIQLFCDSTLSNEEGFQAIGWLSSLIQKDSLYNDEISLDNQRLMINYLGNYYRGQEGNQQDDILLEIPSYDMRQNNQTGLGSSANAYGMMTTTPMPMTMTTPMVMGDSMPYQSNTIQMPMRMSNIPQQSQLFISSNHNNNNGNVNGLNIISEGSIGSKHNSRYEGMDGNGNDNKNPAVGNSLLFQKQNSLQKDVNVNGNSQQNNQLVFQNSQKITNRTDSPNINFNIQPNPFSNPNANANVNINPYSRQRQDIGNEIDIPKCISFVILIAVILAASIAVPLIMTYTDSF